MNPDIEELKKTEKIAKQFSRVAKHDRYEGFRNTAKKIRYLVIEMTGRAGSGHPGGSLSCTDIITALYFSKLKVDPKNPSDPDRDRFILSKGHACPAFYAALALKGFFPVKELKTLREINSRLQGHPKMDLEIGIEVSTGSLGHGFSQSIGFALAGKIDKKDYKVYTLLGDGECDEGSVWEGAMFASKYKLDNLIAIIDKNKIQLDGPTDEIMPLEPLADKWKAFNWNVLEIDGHDFEQIFSALEKAENTKGKPTIIIANTTKGKGVSFMEGKSEWHGKAAKGEQLEKALGELK